jgi:hypothetical protein
MTQPTRGGGGGGRRGGDTNLAHLFQSLEAAMKTSESLTAEQKIRAVLDAAAQSCHHASQAKYKKILKTGNRWLFGMDRKLEARRQRKLLDAAAQYLDHAACRASSWRSPSLPRRWARGCGTTAAWS